MHMASLQLRLNLWVTIQSEDATGENIKSKIMENIE